MKWKTKVGKMDGDRVQFFAFFPRELRDGNTYWLTRLWGTVKWDCSYDGCSIQYLDVSKEATK